MRLWLLLMLCPSLCWGACDSWAVGFGGRRDQFDHQAFAEWSSGRVSCYRTFAWDQRTQALQFVRSLDVPYELYGFSKGAETVLWIMPRVTRRPRYVITIGGWYSVNFDFGRWRVPFDNWFDSSGAGNTSPGVHVPHVRHSHMQAWVNQFY